VYGPLNSFYLYHGQRMYFCSWENFRLLSRLNKCMHDVHSPYYSFNSNPISSPISSFFHLSTHQQFSSALLLPLPLGLLLPTRLSLSFIQFFSQPSCDAPKGALPLLLLTEAILSPSWILVWKKPQVVVNEHQLVNTSRSQAIALPCVYAPQRRHRSLNTGNASWDR